jgi:hypothetical protein
MMTFILPSIVAPFVLLLVIYAVARSRYGIPGVCWLTGVATVPTLLFFSPVVFLHALGSFVLALACLAFRLGPKAVLSASFMAMGVSYFLVFSTSFEELHDLQKIRDHYPLVSVAERLNYEKPRAETSTSNLALADKVEQRLTQSETRNKSGYRSVVLQSLHDRTTDRFVMARGFGPVRMRRLTLERLALPESKPVTLPTPPEPEPYDPSTKPPLAIAQKSTPDVQTEFALLSMHEVGLNDFFDRERLGYVKDRNHVAGFEPHQLSAVPKLSAKDQWQLVSLELVSLLKHKTPVAYVSRDLPRMDKLNDAPTRPLTTFEQGAIERLRADEDLVVDERPNRIRMVGSLRAAKSCLGCHAVQRGELLGAFSYELVPERPVPEQKDDGNSPNPKA